MDRGHNGNRVQEPASVTLKASHQAARSLGRSGCLGGENDMTARCSLLLYTKMGTPDLYFCGLFPAWFVGLCSSDRLPAFAAPRMTIKLHLPGGSVAWHDFTDTCKQIKDGGEAILGSSTCRP